MNATKSKSFSYNSRELKNYYKTVQKINVLEKYYTRFTDEQLKDKTKELKNQLQNCKTVRL